MKKTFLIIIIFLISIFLLGNINTSAKETLEEPGLYYVEVENLTLDNINEKITENILALEPYINPVYKDCILMKYDSKEKIKEQYLAYLDSKGRVLEVNKYTTSSIRIKKVLIHATENDLEKKYDSYTPAKEYYCKNS